MKIKIIFIIFFCVLLPCPAVHAAAPQRIVSLKPNITDIVYALGLGDRLVGVTKYCDIPPSPSPLPSGERDMPKIVADYTQPHIERIVALSPDIVLGSEENSSRRSVESLGRLGIKVELFSFTTLDETIGSIGRIGAALGAPVKGKELARKMQRELDALKEQWAKSAEDRVVVVWGIRPLVVAGRGTYMDELLGFVSASNAMRGGKIKYPRIGIEELIAMNPDAIIDLSMGSESDSGAIQARPWDGVNSIKAVRDGNVVRLGAGLFRAGPGLPAALEKLANLIHTAPDAP